jgi:hypothetical protein
MCCRVRSISCNIRSTCIVGWEYMYCRAGSKCVAGLGVYVLQGRKYICCRARSICVAGVCLARFEGCCRAVNTCIVGLGVYVLQGWD